jgi:hypothetical protein
VFFADWQPLPHSRSAHVLRGISIDYLNPLVKPDVIGEVSDDLPRDRPGQRVTLVICNVGSHEEAELHRVVAEVCGHG